MVLFHNFRMKLYKMVLFYHSIDEFQTTNEWSIKLSIIKFELMLYNISLQFKYLFLNDNWRLEVQNWVRL